MRLKLHFETPYGLNQTIHDFKLNIMQSKIVVWLYANIHHQAEERDDSSNIYGVINHQFKNSKKKEYVVMHICFFLKLRNRIPFAKYKSTNYTYNIVCICLSYSQSNHNANQRNLNMIPQKTEI